MRRIEARRKNASAFRLRHSQSLAKRRQNFCKRFRKFRPLISAVGEERLQKWKHPEQCRHDENASVAILNVGRMNNGVGEEASCTTKNVPLLALDLLTRIVPVRII